MPYTLELTALEPDVAILCPMNEPIQDVGIAVIAFGILKVLEIAVKGLVDKKKGGNHNGQAGEKSADYWKIEFRTIVERAVDERMAPQLQRIESALTMLTRWIRWKEGRNSIDENFK